MDIHELIDRKRQEMAKLQAQLEVLEELAGEAGMPSSGRRRRGRPPGRPPATGRTTRRRGRPGRAGRGANQQSVLSVLTATPTRVRDIAARAKLTAGATNQVLLRLRKLRQVQKAGRARYRLVAAARGSASAAAETVMAATAPRRKRATRARNAKASRSRKPKEGLPPAKGREGMKGPSPGAEAAALTA